MKRFAFTLVVAALAAAFGPHAASRMQLADARHGDPRGAVNVADDDTPSRDSQRSARQP
jgi:hypothetical protein